MRTLRHPIKILGTGELTTKLTVHAHGFSARARELIEGAGGTVVVLGGDGKPVDEADAAPKPKRAPKAAAPAAAEPAADEPVADEPVADEPEPVAEATDAEPEASDTASEESDGGEDASEDDGE